MAEPKKEPTVQKWLQAISLYERDFKKWEHRTEKILKKYRDDSRSDTRPTAKFNILWSNVQTIVPAVFSRLPKPDVSRRFRDNDPVGRVAALILERALEFEIEHYPDYRAAMKNSVFDRFLGGRGVSWVRYEPHISTQTMGAEQMPEDGLQITEDADEAESEEEQTEEVLDYECSPCDYVHWRDFGHTQARTWEEVNAVWRRVYMGKAALKERFGEELAKKIPLDTKPKEQKEGGYQDGGEYEAAIYEIWDKASGKALWISKSMPDVLDEKDDPLGLESFFPCPKPLYATLTTDTLVPVPDYTLYQDQANTLDLLADRIDGLIMALQVKGVHDAAIPELKRLFSEAGNNDLIPVENWQAFAEKNGLVGAINIVDLTPIFGALQQAYAAMEQQKAQVYEITGLSDIVRGQGDAQETATAQKLKGQYASLRLKSMQGEVGQFAAELLQIKAQIICKFFQPETIAKIAAVQQMNEADRQYIPQAIALLKDETLSDFRIDISADSLVQIDEEAEKQAATELVGVVSKFMTEAAKAPPEVIPILGELLKFAFARYKIGKGIEGAVDQFLDQAKQKAANPQPPKPDPAVEKAQIDAQTKMQLAQAEVQQEQQRVQVEMQVEQQRAQMEAQLEQQRMAAQQQQEERVAEREAQQSRFEAALAEREAVAQRNFDAAMEQSRQQFEIMMQRMKDETTLEVAELGAKTTLATAQQSAAEGASQE